MQRFTCAVVAALIAVACSSSESGSTIADPTTGSQTNPNDPGNGATPTNPTTPNAPGTSGLPNTDPPTKGDCDALASAFCQRMSACDSLAIKLLGNVQTCADRFSRSCLAGAAAPGTGLTRTSLAKCAPSLATAACDSLLGATGFGPAGCSFKGTLPDGAKCAFEHQCQSGTCSAQDGGCGVCEHVAAVGGSCAGSSACAPGAYCTDSTKLCAARLALGQACSASGAECVENGSCVKGVCTAFGKRGAACDKNGVDGPLCNLLSGEACIGAPATCTAFPVAATAGAACGFDATSLTVCGAGLVCSYDNDGTGTCVAETPEGGACAVDPHGGASGCAVALECIGGKCAYTTAAVCQ